ncbi:unnamed protein product [Closterium sp. NIES-53]
MIRRIRSYQRCSGASKGVKRRGEAWRGMEKLGMRACGVGSAPSTTIAGGSWARRRYMAHHGRPHALLLPPHRLSSISCCSRHLVIPEGLPWVSPSFGLLGAWGSVGWGRDRQWHEKQQSRCGLSCRVGASGIRAPWADTAHRAPVSPHPLCRSEQISGHPKFDGFVDFPMSPHLLPHPSLTCSLARASVVFQRTPPSAIPRDLRIAAGPPTANQSLPSGAISG